MRAAPGRPGSSSRMTRDRQAGGRPRSRARVRFASVQPIRSLIARYRALPRWLADALLAAVLLVEGVDRGRSPSRSSTLGDGAWPSPWSRSMAATGSAFRRRLPARGAGRRVHDPAGDARASAATSTDTSPARSSGCCSPATRLGAHADGPPPVGGRRLRDRGAAASAPPSTPTDDDLTSYVSSIAPDRHRPDPVRAGAAQPRAPQPRAARQGRRAPSSERAAAADAAALEERTRIAGELHDVVAHALSAMTVQASAARRMAERDPERAESAFATVEATGREALTELRRLLGVLRREDEELGARAAAEPRAHQLARPARPRGRPARRPARRGRARSPCPPAST